MGTGLKKHNNTIQNVDGTAPGPEEECSGAGGDQGNPNREPPRGAVFGLQKPTPAHTCLHDTSQSEATRTSPSRQHGVAVGWSQREKAGAHTPETGASMPQDQPQPAPCSHLPALSLPHSPPSRCFPEQVAEADTREHHSAPVRSTVNSHLQACARLHHEKVEQTTKRSGQKQSLFSARPK